jgi:hypothetical protein
MSQYTSSYTSSDGTVTNTILDSVTNIQTITVTASTGQTATATTNVIGGGATSAITSLSANLTSQLIQQGANVNLLSVSGGITSTVVDTSGQQFLADNTASVTGDPPPAEAQAIPVSNQSTVVSTTLGPALTAPEAVAADDVAAIQATTFNANANPVSTQNLTTSSTNGITGALLNTTGQATSQGSQNIYVQSDWRVRLQLAPTANYLYKNPQGAGILTPLIGTQGVLFPYTPSIAVTYAAGYEPTAPTHSNYKIYNYTASSIDNINITCDFTAQDTFEANYLLAVIHFFRSMTKMFYGNDVNPINGTPPPLCYLTGMGAFNFDKHPLAITNFTYTLPTEVDYIPAGNAAYVSGTPQSQTGNGAVPRYGTGIGAGGLVPIPIFNNQSTGIDPTYVPTKINLAITAHPIVSRNDISNNFSLNDYGTGALYRGSTRNGAGIW